MLFRSFDAATKEIRDSASGMAIFKTDDIIQVVNSTSNDGTYTVTTGNTAAKVVVSEAIVTEDAGATVTIIGPVQNYAQIAAADVVGDLPAPPRLEITNTTVGGIQDADVYIAHNILSAPATFAHILEAESATGGTMTEDASSSGGYKNIVSWEVTTETLLLDWTLSTTLLNACASNYFRLLLRMSYPYLYDDLWVKMKLSVGLSIFWESEWSLPQNPSSLIELATVQLPPNLIGIGDSYPLHLKLYGKRAITGTHTLEIDYMQLSPLDGWRKLEPNKTDTAQLLPYNARLVDDEIDNYLYTDSWSTPGRFGNYHTASAPILLCPNKLQRFYFLHNIDSTSAPIARTLSIKAYYRPRRCSI